MLRGPVPLTVPGRFPSLFACVAALEYRPRATTEDPPGRRSDEFTQPSGPDVVVWKHSARAETLTLAIEELRDSVHRGRTAAAGSRDSPEGPVYSERVERWGISTTASVALPGVRFETVAYEPGHWSERHAHDLAFFDLLLSGAQAARWDGSEVRRTPGTLALMPVGEAHATDSILPARTFQIAVGRDWPGSAERKGSLGGRCAHLDAGPIAWHLTRMWAEFRRRDDLTPAVLEGWLRAFLDTLAGEKEDGSEASWLRKARDYVREHAREGFAVADVAQEVGVDPAHLMRSYAARYGVTLGDDARRHRVAHACRLLRGSRTSLGEVAQGSGFADQSHLNRVFKAHTGLTPRAYRTTCLGR